MTARRTATHPAYTYDVIARQPSTKIVVTRGSDGNAWAHTQMGPVNYGPVDEFTRRVRSGRYRFTLEDDTSELIRIRS